MGNSTFNIDKKNIVVFFLFVSTMVVNYNIGRIDTSTFSEKEYGQKIDPRWYKTITFGNFPSGIDWELIRVLQDTSLKKVPKNTHPAIYYNLDLISELDRGFFDAYYAGAHLLSIARGDGEGAKELLEKADDFRRNQLQKFPRSFQETVWENHWALSVVLAYVYLFNLNDLPKAAEQFTEASKVPGAPEYLIRLRKKLNQEDGQYLVGLNLLKFMMSSSKVEELHKELETKYLHLSINLFLQRMNRQFQQFRITNSGPVQTSWIKFRNQVGIREKDPWGGILSINSNGIIDTTIPHSPVFGLP